MIPYASKIAQEKSPTAAVTRRSECSIPPHLDKLEDLLADGDIVAGDCEGQAEMSDT